MAKWLWLMVDWARHAKWHVSLRSPPGLGRNQGWGFRADTSIQTWTWSLRRWMIAMLKIWGLKWNTRNFEGVLEDVVMKDILLLLPIIEDETWHVISNMLDCEEVFGESSTTVVKVMLIVEYHGHQLFKATLVSLLNANPFFLWRYAYIYFISTYFNNNNASMHSLCPLPCWTDWKMMWVTCVSKKSTRIPQQLNLP